MCIIKHKETIFHSCQVDPIVSYFMKFVDQKHAAFTGMLKQPLLLASLFWSLVFVIVFATDIRYTFGDKVALTLSLAACCSLAILTWRHTPKENRRHALALFMFAATAPTLVLLGTMFLDVRFTSSRIVFNAWFLLFCFIALRYLSKTHSSSFLHPAANDPSTLRVGRNGFTSPHPGSSFSLHSSSSSRAVRFTSADKRSSMKLSGPTIASPVSLKIFARANSPTPVSATSQG